MIRITLEGESWQEISREMGLITEASRASRIKDNPGQTDIAKAYEKCPECTLRRLQWILGEYQLGPEERAEILERMR